MTIIIEPGLVMGSIIAGAFVLSIALIYIIKRCV